MPNEPKSLGYPLAVEIERDGDGDVVRVVAPLRAYRGVSFHVAKVYGHGGDADHDPERMQYARLFAAAPRLYAALAALVKPCERALNGGRAFGFWKDDEALLTEARAALAAVRGEV